MKTLLLAELLKLRTTRTFVAVTAVAIGTSVVLTALVAILTEPTAESVLVDVFASDTTTLFILILGVVGVTGEWRHRTIATSLLAAPRRVRFLAAKTIAFAAAGVLMSLLIAAAITLCGFGILHVRDLPTPAPIDLAAQYGRNAVAAALLAGFGVAFGALIRNQVIALVGILLLTFVIEPTLVGLRPDVGRYGPIGALATGVSGLPADETGMGEVDLFAPLPSGLLLLAWIAALFAVAAFALNRRDLT
jgi:ABC-2 type transport system permease protein